MSTDTSQASGRRRRARGVAGLTAVAAVAAAIGVAAFGFGGRDARGESRGDLPPGTATVSRTTLTESEVVGGTLDYGDPVAVTARAGLGSPSSDKPAGGSAGAGGTSGSTGASGGAAGPAQGGTGTITWLPVPGATMARGATVYKVNEQPVPLLYGKLPLYRVLTTGLTGADVTQLERNLAALGYTGFTVDDSYTASTAAAVKQWQADLGVTETGTVDVNQALVAPAGIRIAEVKAHVGDPGTGEILSYTGTTRTVRVALDVAKQQLVHKGGTATVTLPDGRPVTGTVTSIGTVTSGSGSTGGTGGSGTGTGGTGGAGNATIEVVITIADQKALGTLQAAPVDITLISARRENVLTVPVAALVALREGGYGVQVVEGNTTRYVAVKTGMFANGQVEITGEGIDEGVTVGTPGD